jgi:hypothetical protein
MRVEDMVALGECGLRCPKEENAARAGFVMAFVAADGGTASSTSSCDAARRV